MLSYLPMLMFPQDFASTLKDHLLACILGRQYDAQPPTFTKEDRNQLYISEDHLEWRYGMNVFYTTCQGHSSPSVPSAKVAIVAIANYPHKG